MSQGFSLIEMLLSIALIGVLAGLSVPVYSGYVGHNDVHIAAQTVTQAYRHAQQYARSGEGDSEWGVRVVNGSVTVFKGGSYATRDTAYDEEFVLSQGMSVSGIEECVFTKMTGNPTVTGEVFLSSNAGISRVISVNEKGMVQQ